MPLKGTPKLPTGPALPLPAAAETNTAAKACRVVIGSAVLSEYQDDWDNTMLPDGLPGAPRMLGYVSGGKLKADELRMAFHVHFTITLVRIWSKEESPRYRKLLENFVDLVTATSLIARHSTNAEARAKIQDHLVKYLTSLQELFPQENLHPNHHLSLHIVELLELFGPPSAWWAFAFERYIGILRNINTNNKLCKNSFRQLYPILH